MKNEAVVKSWLNGFPASNPRGNFHTDGESLWSYRLKIGCLSYGEFVIFDYTSSTANFRSQTTSRHVGVAVATATQHLGDEFKVLNPDRLHTTC